MEEFEEFKEFQEFEEDRNRTFNYLLKDGRIRNAETKSALSVLLVLTAGFLKSCNSSNSLNCFE